jgi:hypothetical protein
MQSSSRKLSLSLGTAVLLCAFRPGSARADFPAVIAYDIQAGTPGNQTYGGSLGMDFDVVLDIVVTRLGVFDSGSDGLLLPLNAHLFDRDSLTELAVLNFTADDPGELVGGSRFKDLDAPLELPAGFHGTISADGYGNGELNGNQGNSGADLGFSTNDGGCSISFVGSGRYGDVNTAGGYPDHPDGGPANRYASGSFVFKPTESFTPTDSVAAYVVPDGTIGTQGFGGNLGLDWNANVAIKVTRLGVFDSGSDGLIAPLTARLYNRSTGGLLASLDFTPDDPGDLEGGHRFKPLVPPLQLPAGFRGTIAASGFSDQDLNGNGDIGQTTDNGSCAVSFVGGGRFGAIPDVFPASPDGGLSNKYVAGNFSFEVDRSPPPPPPEPPGNLALVPGDGKVDLSWTAPAGTTPAVSFKLFRGPSLNGAFTQIAQTGALQYSDTGLPNDVLVCYYLKSVAQTGVEGFESTHKCSNPVGPLPPGSFIAYRVPLATRGNQAYGGDLGMDFNVEADIRVLRLGVFDDGSDGLSLPITARVFDRDTQTELAVLAFTPDDAGSLFGGSRFKRLDPPLDLSAGFHGTIAASGYGAGEGDGNQGVGPLPGMATDTGDCRISFLGSGRFGNDPVAFPGTPDGGPPDRYAAGTFEFEGRGDPFKKVPGVPVVTSTTSGSSQVKLEWQAPPAGDCALAPESYRLFRSKDGGAFSEVAQPTEPEYLDDGLQTGSDYCYRVRAVAAGGLEGADSAVVCETAGRFIAYKVPGGTLGDQVDGAIVGMDFDVKLDIKVIRLGAFDSGSEGLALPLTVRLFDRDQELEMASLDFAPGEGILLGGSRFKELDGGLDLPAGFHGSIVAEGYFVDEPYGAGGAWTFDQGPCSISFVGRGRTGTDVAVFPPVSAGGRPDQFAAGTFQFEPVKLGTPRGAIAYQIPAGTAGNQNFGGQLGLDFNVNVPITIIRLGVFDSASDGLNAPITARVYDRKTQTELASLLFTTDDPGDLEDGNRFKELDPPLELPAGLEGTLAASGYGDTELNGNQGAVDLGLGTDDGGCAISFVGSGRYGLDPAVFPPVPDGGPVNRYAAGTFEFKLTGGPPPQVTFRRGDVDSNGLVELTDPILVLNYLFLGGRDPDCKEAADTDDNAIIDITDAVNSLTYQFLGGTDLPSPGPRVCGADPTVDGLGCVTGCR